jgi:hypothetical protein
MENRRIFKIGVYVGIALLVCALGLCWALKNVDQLPVGARDWVFSNTLCTRVYAHFPSLIPERYLDPKNNIKHFAEALAKRDVDALKEHIVFPFERKYPLPPIETIEEFVAAIPRLFEEDDIKGMQDIDAWEKMGWRGYMYKNGLVWLSDDFCLTGAGGCWGTEKEHELWLKCVKKEIASLHQSLQEGVSRPLLSFITEDGAWRGRIDVMESKSEDDEYIYRLAAYKAGTPITAKPDLVVMCKNKVEGSACNEYFISKGIINDSDYIFSINRAGHIDDAEMDFRYPGMNVGDERASHAKSWVWK